MANASDFLGFSCKRTDRLNLKAPLAKYVVKAYGQDQADDILLDVEEVLRRRTETVAVSGGGAGEGAKEILASYYRALAVMETRFPISRDPSHAQLPFYWMHAMNPRKKCKQYNMHFEKASVLFNIGALLSQQAVKQNRDSQEGFKAAVQNFQEAAGVFFVVREVALKVENPKPTDLSSDFLMMAEKLMLAQGQECVFWKAVKDQKSGPAVLGRVAKQTSVLYSETLGLFASAVVREDLDRSWQDLVQSKSWLFEALCQYHSATAAKTKEDISTEIARLNQAVMLLERLQKNGKFSTQALPNMIRELTSSATSRLQKAEQDNASVYLKRIPPFNDLPTITGAQFVKIGELAYLDASNEHIFADLIPEPTTKALSRYSDMVDSLMRKLTETLNGATDDARLKLKQYELPEILDAVTSVNPSLLPEGLKKELHEIDDCGGLSYLDDLMQQLKGLKETSTADLAKIEADLDQDAAEDAELRERHRGKWNVPSSASQAVEFRKIIGPYRDNFATADKSDNEVASKLEQRRDRLVFLSVDQCTERLPKLEAGMISTTDLEPQTLVANLRNSLDQMMLISDERAGIDESLKETKNGDNLLPKLSATGVGSHEDLFKEELKKYDIFVQDVQENVRKQNELLTYIRSALEEFKRTFDIPAWKQKVDAYSRDIKADIGVFYNVRDSLGEGMRFYMNLKSAVDVLKQQVTDYILSRRLDREDRSEMIKTQEAAEQLPTPDPSVYASLSAVPSVTSDGSAVQSEAPLYPGQPPIATQSTAVTSRLPPHKTESFAYRSGDIDAPSAPPSQFPSHDAMVESPNPYVPSASQTSHYNAYQPPSAPPPSGPPSGYGYQGYQPPPGPPSGYGYQGYQPPPGPPPPYGYQAYQSTYAPPTGPPPPQQQPASYQGYYARTDHYQNPSHQVYSQQTSYDPYGKPPPPHQGYQPPPDYYGTQQRPYDPYQKPPPPPEYQGQQQPYDPSQQQSSQQGYQYPGQQYYQQQ